MESVVSAVKKGPVQQGQGGRVYTTSEQQEMAVLEQQWGWQKDKPKATGKGKGYRTSEEKTAIGVYTRKYGKFPPGFNRHDKRNLRNQLGLSNDVR